VLVKRIVPFVDVGIDDGVDAIAVGAIVSVGATVGWTRVTIAVGDGVGAGDQHAASKATNNARLIKFISLPKSIFLFPFSPDLSLLRDSENYPRD
jgi:hypothetical protein